MLCCLLVLFDRERPRSMSIFVRRREYRCEECMYVHIGTVVIVVAVIVVVTIGRRIMKRIGTGKQRVGMCWYVFMVEHRRRKRRSYQGCY